MRKKIIIMATVLPLVLIICLATGLYCLHLVSVYQSYTAQMEQAVRAGDWEGAQGFYDTMDQHWSRMRSTLQVWINHRDTDAVTTSLIELRLALQSRDSEDALLCLAFLHENVGHLYHRDALTLSNLL